MSSKNKAVPFLPEVVSTYRGGSSERWKVESGTTNRGDAWTDFTAHTIRVPSDTSPTARVIRTHELTHARISPNTQEQLDAVSRRNGLSVDALIASEEFRVNTVTKLLGFDTDLLQDGSEKRTGESLAKQDTIEAHNAVINFGVGLAGTKAFRTFVAGLKAGGKPEWAKEIQDLQKEVKKIVRNADSSELGSTYGESLYDPIAGVDVEVPYGFARYTARLAKAVQNYYAVKPEPASGNGASGIEVPVGYRTAQFAPLVFDETIKRNKPVKGHLHRRKTAMTTGKRVLYPQRAITDPQKRVFGQKVRSSGGIIVVDISGSMEISNDELNKILDLAPSSIVVAYSHKRGSQGIANAWVLAERGKRVETLPPIGNVGNGVDGPILEWAISKRKGNEPIIWVCDGQVTDGANDHGHEELTEVCGRIVAKHKITQANDVDGAIKLLQSPSKARSSKKVYGRVGYWLENNISGYSRSY